jgi:hypothetical protein
VVQKKEGHDHGIHGTHGTETKGHGEREKRFYPQISRFHRFEEGDVPQ